MGSILEQPKNSGSHYHNYKGTDCIILMTVVDLFFFFIYIYIFNQFFYPEVGMNGRNSNRGAWAQSPIKKSLENNTLNLPKSMPLSGDLGVISLLFVLEMTLCPCQNI